MKKNSQKIIGTIIALIVLVITIILAIPKVTKMIRISKITDPEILTAMTYEQLTDDDKKVDNCDYVEFSAFFTRDLDDDGYAEKIKGTCRELSQTDTLYAEINVLTQGHFDGGKITLNGNNFTWNTSIVEDSIVEGDYIGETKEINLKNNLNPGSQKLLWGTIKSKIGNNKNDYSQVNSITLTGTYYDDEGNATEINKTIEFPVDWYGETKTEVNKYYYSLYNFESYQNQILDIATIVKENSIDLSFKVAVSETKQKLLLKKQEAQITIPELNGYEPIEVLVDEKNIDKNYNEETGILTITRNAEEDDNGVITKTVARSNIYNVTVKYPLEAYDQMTADSVVLNIPVKGINEGYNNPGTEFSNPHISTAEGILTVTYSKPSGKIWNIYPTVGNNERVNGAYRYQISKEAPTDIFNGNVYEDKTTKYPVRWEVVIGDYTAINKIELQEQDINENKKSDEFLSSSNTYSSMYDYITTTGVYFDQASSALGSDGWIKIYNDETDSLLETFNSSTWGRYNKDNPYSVNIKSLRIETSKPIANTSFSVYQIKEVDDELITESFSQEDFEKLSFVYTYLKGTIEAPDGVTYDNGLATSEINKSNYAYYDAPYSIATLAVNPNQITNQKTENVTFTIVTSSQNMLEKAWVNGSFLIELPDSVINASVNGVEISDENVQLGSCDVVEENGKYFIKIYTKNQEEKLYTITVNASIAGNPLNPTENKSVKLYSYNENCNNYYNKSSDLYDLDNDGLTSDNIGYNSVGLSLIAPSGLLTTEYVTDYDDEESITIAPNIADIEKSDETRTANINVSITNGYSGTISDIVILGKIPFEGNTYVLNGGDLNSKFTANIVGAISVPENLRDATKIYYSTNENPTKDLNEEANGWTLAENVTDWNEIRTYLIDMGTYSLAKTENEVFTYEVKVPAGLGYNTATFSSHAVYYNLDTENGKLAVKTEPNKVGIQVVAKYSLQLTKNKKAHDNVFVAGATYRVTTEDVDGNEIAKSATTDENGVLIFRGLYINREYTLKEISAPKDYVISSQEIVFVGKIEEDGTFKFDVQQGNFKEELDEAGNAKSTVQVTIDEKQNYLVKADIEDEVKYILKINKKDDNENALSKVKFLIRGKEVNKLLKTNEYGQIIIRGLYPNEEYEIQEVQADGYYVDESPRTFKLVRNDGGILVLEIDNEDKLTFSINETIEEVQSMVTLEIKNEKIPTYELQILKVEEDLDEENIESLKVLEDAHFVVESIDTGDKNEYITDTNGLITVNNLYQYKENRNITGEYIIKETKAPSGYSNNSEEIHIVVTTNEENELEAIIDNKDILKTYKTVIVEENIVKLVLQDKTLFKLSKIDSEKVDENDNPIRLSNAEFIIYELDENGQVVDYAKDVNGFYIGNKNENGDYTVITDSNGTISLPLRAGIYKSVEVTYPDGYQELSDVEVFKVQGEVSGNEQNIKNSVYEINYIEDLVDLSNDVNLGNSYKDIRVKLMRALDFNEDESYRNPDSDLYGDLNEDGEVNNIKEELTKISGIGFTPIGSSHSSCFSGIFEGNNNEIRNLYINSNNDNIGLFGYAEYADIKDFGITGSITGNTENNTNVGAFVGYAEYVSIKNCYNKASVQCICDEKKSLNIGGIVGYNKSARLIENCYNEGKIYGSAIMASSYVGGITGSSYNIRNCYNDGEVINFEGNNNNNSTSNYKYTGGIAGQGSYIYNCYNTAKVSGNTYFGYGYIGGIAGNGNNIEKCYNTGNVEYFYNNESSSSSTFSAYVGGIVGLGGDIKKSYNKGDVKSNYYHNLLHYNYVGGIVGRAINGDFEACYNEGNIIGKGGKNVYIGGVIGETIITVSKCNYNVGLVSGSGGYSYVGGVIGYNNGSNKIYDTYNEGNVTSEGSDCSYAGGIIGGSSTYATIRNVYNIGDVESLGDNSYVGGIAGREISYFSKGFVLDSINKIGITENTQGIITISEDMKSLEFFNNINENNVWRFEEGAYPKLDINYQDEQNTEIFENITEIQYIEDLVELSKSVNSGNNYDGITVNLNKTIDFNDDESYKSPSDTSYGDLNGNGQIEDIKTELTTGNGFTPIGKNSTNSFSGTFDGHGNEIKNLYINQSISVSSNPTNNDIGLFGDINHATIKNLGVETNLSIKWTWGIQNIGGIVGKMACSTLDNCYIKGNICADNEYGVSTSYEGGLVGYAYNSNVTTCYSLGKIMSIGNGSSGTYTGGIVGFLSENSSINHCHNDESISGMNVGGIIGRADTSKIIRCYNTETINGINNYDCYNSSNAAGIVCSISNSVIDYCYNIGQIIDVGGSQSSNGVYVGGICAIASTGSKINNCYNNNDVSATGNASNSSYSGGIVGVLYGDTEINNCNNGNISCSNSMGNSYAGGICGSAATNSFIKNCNNTENVFSESTGEAKTSYVGGIVGYGAYVYNCYNTGDIQSKAGNGKKTATGASLSGAYSGGIVGYVIKDIKNCYNTGNIDAYSGKYSRLYTGGIAGNLGIIKNCYTLGNINVSTKTSQNYVYVGPISGYGSNENSYYLDSITYNGQNFSSTNKGATAYDYMISSDFYEDLNIDSVWYQRKNDFPKLIDKTYIADIVDSTEVTIKNTIKKFEITTEVKNGIGGSITGENENPFENVEIYQNNQKSIIMEPDEGYEISDIIINGISIDYIVNSEGIYVLNEGYFENVQEDKHVVVIYSPMKQTLTINKIDENDDSCLEGAEFNIEQIEDKRENVNNKIGEIINSDKIFDIPDSDKEISINKELIPNGETLEIQEQTDYTNSFIRMNQYYFPKNGSAYVSDNKNINNSQANSMVIIDLRNKTGNFSISVNAAISSEANHDYGYAALLTTSTVPTHTATEGQFIHISGTQSAKDYTINCTGGNYYFLHFGYYKDGSGSSGSDCFTINKITLCENKTISLCFVKTNDKYVSNNKGYNDTVANSYIPIDLTNVSEDCMLVVNANISSESSHDYGYATVTQSTEAPMYEDLEGRFIYISGYQSARDYITKLSGGNLYYLHFGYYKDSQNSSGNDNFTINSIGVYGIKNESFYFVENNGTFISNNQNVNNTVANSYIPIDLREEVGKYNLVVNAEISSQSSADYGYITLKQNTVIPEYNNTSGRFAYISGIQGAKDYTTTLDGGNMYYLHFGYRKNEVTSSGNDTFTINSINILPKEESYYSGVFETNNYGKIKANVPIGTYKITEIKAPEGYTLDSTPRTIEVGPGKDNSITITNKHKTGLLVHHYFKDKTKEGTEQYTTLKVAEDEFSEGDINQKYTTSPRFDLDNLYLEKSEDGKYITPSNASGNFGDSLIEVNYYYELEPIELKINHYLEGTTNSLADENVEEFFSELEFDEEGNYIIKANGSYKIDSNDDYNNLINDRYELVKIESTVNPNLNADDTLSFVENAELTYYYKLKEHKITTEVKPHIENRTNEVTNEKEESEVKGGQITGEEAEVYEIVENGDNSEKIIIATPDEGYVITKITLDSIDGEEANQTVLLDIDNNIEEPSADAEISYTQNTDGSITFSTFDNVTADKHIVVEFNVVPGTVVVHHYIRGTGEEYAVEPVRPVLEDGVTECEDEIKNDYIGEAYATKANENISKRYKLVLTSGETSGTYTDEVKHVYYYYDLDDFPYSVHYFYNEVENEEYVENGEKLRYGSLVTEYEDKADGYVFDKVEPADSLDETKTKLMITEKEEQNVINVYYLSDVNIETEVITHTEIYKDGTVLEGIKGGNVYEIYNDTETKEHEKETILFSKDSQKEIIIVPDEGYAVGTIKLITDDGETNLDVDSLLLEDGKVILNAENGYFKGLRSNVKVEVDFRKKSKLIVKYLAQNEFDEDGNNLELATEEVIDGYESKEVETENKLIRYYINANPIITDDANNEIEPEVVMTADEQTVIYWYEKAKSGVVVRHIEITEEDIRNGLTLDSGTILDIEQKEGEVLSEETVYRNIYSNVNGVVENERYKNYISVDGPEGHDEILFIVSKEEDSQDIIYPEDIVVEVRFYYIRQYKITTEVKSHDEYGYEIKGGTISGEFDDIYELVNKKGSNQKEIVIKPDEGYKVKTITINGDVINYSELIDEENKVVLGASYFKDIIEDKHIIVEFEKEITITEDGGTEEKTDVDSIEEFIENYENIDRIKDVPTADYIIKDLINIVFFTIFGIILIYKKIKK